MLTDNLYDVEIKMGHSETNDLFIDYLSECIGAGDFLDVGCNSGYLIERCGHGHGVDLSAQMVERAKFKGLDVYWGDALYLDYVDNEIPIVVLSCVLEQTDKPMSVLKEALRVAGDRVIGINPIPDASVWGKVGGTKWVKSVIFPGVLRVLHKANIVNLCDTHYYFEIRKELNK